MEREKEVFAEIMKSMFGAELPGLLSALGDDDNNDSEGGEESRELMAHYYSDSLAHLDKRDLKYRVLEDQKAISLGFKLKFSRLMMLLIFDAKRRRVNLTVRLPIVVPGESRDKVTIMLNDLNQTIDIGKFSMDSDDGQIELTHSFVVTRDFDAREFDLYLEILIITADIHFLKIAGGIQSLAQD